MNNKIETVLLYIFDLFFICAGIYLSYLLRFDFHIPHTYLNQFYFLLPSVLFIRFAFLYYFRSYQTLIRYYNFNDLVQLMKPFFYGTVAILLVNIFRNLYVSLLILAALSFFNFKREQFQIWIDKIKYQKLSNLPFIFVLICFTIVLYSLNAYFNEFLIPYKEYLRERYFFANYPSEKSIPRTIIILEILINFTLLAILRVFLNVITNKGKFKASEKSKRTLIYGAGSTGKAVARELIKHSTQSHIEIVGIIDDDPKKLNQIIMGFPVIGNQSQIEDLIAKYQIHEIIIAIPSFKGKKLESFIKLCHRFKLKYKVVDSGHLNPYRENFRIIREVNIEDILDRKIQSTVNTIDKDFLKSKIILVTGAGGSIGSEICRQLTNFIPRKLLVFGKGENSIYNLILELKMYFPESKIIPLIGDIRDTNRLTNIFETYKPEIVFHCAAHKHVPLMELNPGEALKNNFLGTINLARIAEFFQCQRFISISTDKAVNPINMMGISKKLAELFLMSQFKSSKTKFIITRFGNVLASRGSVVPLFLKQISMGGPVTVTDKKVMRYFITIPEAVSLVLKSAEVGDNGDVFILDMGEQINILKLAENLIYLSGLRPYDDIKIVFTGLRPGEKLIEELSTKNENVKATSYSGLYQTYLKIPDNSLFLRWTHEIENYLSIEDLDSCKNIITEIFKQYG